MGIYSVLEATRSFQVLGDVVGSLQVLYEVLEAEGVWQFRVIGVKGRKQEAAMKLLSWEPFFSATGHPPRVARGPGDSLACRLRTPSFRIGKTGPCSLKT